MKDRHRVGLIGMSLGTMDGLLPELLLMIGGAGLSWLDRNTPTQ